MGLQEALDRGIRSLRVFGDSALVIYQIRDEWETRNQKLVPYQKLVKDMINQFEEIMFEHMSREHNQISDALATLAALLQLDTTLEIQSFDIRI